MLPKTRAEVEMEGLSTLEDDHYFIKWKSKTEVMVFEKRKDGDDIHLATIDPWYEPHLSDLLRIGVRNTIIETIREVRQIRR